MFKVLYIPNAIFVLSARGAGDAAYETRELAEREILRFVDIGNRGSELKVIKEHFEIVEVPDV